MDILAVGTPALRLRLPSMPLTDAASYPIWVNLLIFAVAGGSVWLFGTRLTRTLDRIARRSRLGHVFVGMLLLGGITSLPELANVVTASANGNPALAVINLLGSSAINILLLAIADAIVGRRAVTSIVAQPSTMMMGTLCMIVLIAIAALVVLDDILLETVGLGSLVVGLLSLGFFWLATGYDERSPWTVERSGAEAPPAPSCARRTESPLRLWLGVIFWGSLMFAAGYALSQTGDAIAEQAGIRSGIVGFALIGTATSLPELVTIIAALKIRRPEMAFGQILGTNFINLSMLPLGDLIFDGRPVMNILGSFKIISALLAATLIGIFIVGLLEHRNRTVFRMGGDSAAVILVFALGAGLLAFIPEG